MATASSFYGRSLALVDQLTLDAAEEMEGVGAELAVARVHLARLFENPATEAGDLVEALEVIAKLSATSHRISNKASAGFSENLAAVLREAGELMAVST